jgi:hypothetical protein
MEGMHSKLMSQVVGKLSRGLHTNTWCEHHVNHTNTWRGGGSATDAVRRGRRAGLKMQRMHSRLRFAPSQHSTRSTAPHPTE